MITTFEYEPNSIPYTGSRLKSIVRDIPIVDDPLIPIDSAKTSVDSLITIGLRLKRIVAEDAVTGVTRVRSLEYADGCTDVDFATLCGCDFVAMSGMTNHRISEMLAITDKSYSATMLYGSRLPGAAIEGARIYYGKVTEWISGTGIDRSIRTDYEFDTSGCALRHCHVGKSYPDAVASESGWERSLCSEGIPAGGLVGHRGFGYQSPVSHYFREHIGAEPEMIACTTFEYRDNQYQPLTRQTYSYRTIDKSEVVVGLHYESLVRRNQQALSPITLNDWHSVDDISHFNISVDTERQVCHQCVTTKYFSDGSSRESSTTYLYTEPDQLASIDNRDMVWKTDSLTRCSQRLFPIGSIRQEAGITMEQHTAIAEMATRGFAAAAKVRGLRTLPTTQMWILRANGISDTLVRHYQYGRFETNGGLPLTRPTQISTGIKGAPYCDIQHVASYDRYGFPVEVTQTAKSLITYTRGYSGDELISVATGDASQGGILKSTFAHRPLIGCTESVTPSGKHVFYDYLGGRLSSICNTQGQMITKYDYETYAQNPYPYEGVNRITTYTYTNGDNDYAVSHQLLNGFGHEIATQLAGYGSGGESVTTLTYYDALMRPVRKWMPLPIDDELSDYFYDKDMASAQAVMTYADAPAYEQLVYNDNASEQPKCSAMPGARFAMHPSVTELTCCNPDDEERKVIRWKFDDGMPVNDGFYQAGELDCLRQVDGDGRVTLTFTDCLGKTVLVRRLGEDAYRTYNTYYIRDAWGNPLMVIPPMAARDRHGIRGNKSEADARYIKNYCYIYGYDPQLRLTMKQLPGCAPISYAYDGDSRLALSRDGNMTERGRVVFTLYDNQGRVAVTGTADDIGVMDGADGSLPGKVAMLVRRNNATINQELSVEAMTIEQSGYTFNDAVNDASGLLPHAQILTVNYYDDYDWIGDDLANRLKTSASHISSPKGLLTGSLTATLSSSDHNSYLIQKICYDINERVVATIETSPVVDVIERSTTYNRGGQPTMITTTMRSGDASSSYSRAMAYDRFGRSIRADFVVGSQSRMIGRYAYNQLGQLSKVTMQGSYERTMDYDMHGWLRHWRSCGVEQTLNFADGTYPCYNGFISAKTTTIDGYHKRYDYEYNKRGFLTRAHYRSDDATEDFSVNYSMDLHGNFSGLQRRSREYYGSCPIVEDFDISLEGNQVIAIDNVMGRNSLMESSLSIPQGDYVRGSFDYDANGNLTRDLSRDIEEITYNVLNLPQTALMGDGSRIEWSYSAAGGKLSERIFDENGGFLSRTDYVADAIFDDRGPDRIQLPEGYVTMCDFFSGASDGLVFHAYVPDYQGNILRVVNTSTGQIEQTTDYYPYGMPHVDATGAEVNRIKFGGKELVTNRGLNAADFSARWHAVALGRFTTPDPCAETYPDLSPYIFCASNPVNFSDPDGRKLIFVGSYWHCKDALSILNRRLPNSFIGKYDGNTVFPDKNNRKFEILKNPLRPESSYDYPKNYILDIIDGIIDAKEDIFINVKSNSLDLIGGINSATIDVADMNSLGNGKYVNAFGALIHEISEQYLLQAKNYSQEKAHNGAMMIEGNANNCQFEGNREENNGSMTIQFNFEDKKYTITIMFDYNHNKITIGEPQEMSFSIYTILFLVLFYISGVRCLAESIIENKLDLITDQTYINFFETTISDKTESDRLIRTDVFFAIMGDLHHPENRKDINTIQFRKIFAKKNISKDQIRLLLILINLLYENEIYIKTSENDLTSHNMHLLSKSILIELIEDLRLQIQSAENVKTNSILEKIEQLNSCIDETFITSIPQIIEFQPLSTLRTAAYTIRNMLCPSFFDLAKYSLQDPDTRDKFNHFIETKKNILSTNRIRLILILDELIRAWHYRYFKQMKDLGHSYFFDEDQFIFSIKHDSISTQIGELRLE